MQVTRWAQAPRYESPGHHAMSMRRLQGKEAGVSDTVWIGLSTIEPGGGTDLTASSVEKMYVVVEGELTVETSLHGAVHTNVLSVLDSCRIEPGESRRLINRSAVHCRVLLVMPHT